MNNHSKIKDRLRHIEVAGKANRYGKKNTGWALDAHRENISGGQVCLAIQQAHLTAILTAIRDTPDQKKEAVFLCVSYESAP